MEGQVLGGGVVVLIAAGLWLVYLLPTWYSRHQYNATERNAVRMSQALRILAETSDQPEELRVDLQTRAARRQTKLARQAEQQRRELEEAAARAEAERVREEAEFEKERLRNDALAARDQRRADEVAYRELAKVRVQAERARASAAAAAEHQRLRAELHAARNAPAAVAARHAHARRTVRLIALGITVLGLAGAIWGVVSTQVLLAVVGILAGVLGVAVLQRMSRVARRATPAVVVPLVVEAPRKRVSILHDEPAPKWTPRSLPQPLTTVAGSRAAIALDAKDAREALRRAAIEEAARQKAAEHAPVRIETARPAAAKPAMDDAAIEAHVRQLLASRAAS
ncbi:large exoprotein [Microbacterium sp. NC79]|uniref:large exoprotein n=1 Tax=Microbacterium sp. NC79 TaxID=2851009 RepID=UPI001C2BB8EA|nr:large exoprotein [Microbacterium sp. NC79]MBV0895419.1 large exoprotein [Microbacterium sp. NC79]